VKKTLIFFISSLLILLLVLFINTWLHTPLEREQYLLHKIDLDKKNIVQHMSEAIQFQTISSSQKPISETSFNQFVDWLKQTYPILFRKFEIQQVEGYSLFLKWQGSNESLKPILLTAHYDVVPVISGTESLWRYPPFSGEIAEGYVWGRGALDDKGAVISMLEAASKLEQQGFQPERSIYFSFGHDEELGGANGAGKVVEFAKNSNIQFLWSLDEGAFLFEGMIPGVEKIMGTINVAEKGSVTLKVIATSEGGHSSMPPKHTAVGILADALIKLEKNPMPGGLDGLSSYLLDAASRYMPFSKRMLFANQWLFKKIIEDKLYDSVVMKAQMITTTAPTMLSASPKANVLAIEAVATVNFRIHPRDSIKSITEHVNLVINNPNVRVEQVDGWGNPASRVSSIESEGYKTLVQSTYEIHDSVVLTPGLMIAASDSRHYSKISDNSYRFNPMLVTRDDIASFHGTNEKISINNLILATKIYSRIMVNGSKK
jgi:carboxypeptidase PM20D1